MRGAQTVNKLGSLPSTDRVRTHACPSRSPHRVLPPFPYPRNAVTGPPRRRGGGARTNHFAVAGPALYLPRESYHCSASTGIKAASSGRHASPRTKLRNRRRSPRAKIPPALLRLLLPFFLLARIRRTVSRIRASTRIIALRSCVVLEPVSFRTVWELEGADFGRCRSGLRRGCGYQLGRAGSGWVPATGSGSWNRTLLQTLEKYCKLPPGETRKLIEFEDLKNY